MLVTSPDASHAYSLTAKDKNVVYRSTLTRDNPRRTVEVAIPYITLTESKEWAKLRRMRFDDSFDAVRGY